MNDGPRMSIDTSARVACASHCTEHVQVAVLHLDGVSGSVRDVDASADLHCAVSHLDARARASPAASHGAPGGVEQLPVVDAEDGVVVLVHASPVQVADR